MFRNLLFSDMKTRYLENWVYICICTFVYICKNAVIHMYSLFVQ